MTDLKSVPAVRIGDNGLSLYDLLYSLHLRGRLRPLLSAAAAEQLILDGAKKAGLGVADGELQKAADQFRRRAGLTRAEDAQRWLRANRLSQEDLENGLERAILQRRLVRHAAGKEAVEKYFAANRARFEGARLSRIVVRDEGLANELLSQLREEGADFVALLRKHSTDERGKRLGPRTVARKRLPPPIEQAVFAAKGGDVVGPFKVGDAWHLLRVEGLPPARLTRRVAAAVRTLLLRRWLREQAAGAGIEMKLPGA
jgi:parvulin-like peptidyl-prolyl isomerase